jgi:hypothetical protein
MAINKNRRAEVFEGYNYIVGVTHLKTNQQSVWLQKKGGRITSEKIGELIEMNCVAE